MAIKYYEKYPQRWESPSQDYPQGAFKNLSALGEQDGSYLEKDWLNDQSGFFGALLRNAEMTPNGEVDTAKKSQFYDALVKVAKESVDLSAYRKKDDLLFKGMFKVQATDEVAAGVFLQGTGGTVRGQVVATDQGLQLTQYPEGGGLQTFTFPNIGGEVALASQYVKHFPHREGDCTQDLQNLINQLHDMGGGIINLDSAIYVISSTIYLKRGVYLIGQDVRCTLKNTSTSSIIETYKFQELLDKKAWDTGDDPDMTTDFGVLNMTLLGNGYSSENSSIIYGLAAYGRRCTFENILIANIAGIGFRHDIRGSHKVFDYSKNKSIRIDRVDVIDVGFEGVVLGGNSDLTVGSMSTNNTGRYSINLDTSRLFPDEPVNGFVADNVSLRAYNLNLNGSNYGFTFSSRGVCRLNIDSLITGGGWGLVNIGESTHGIINNLHLKTNNRSYNNVTKPSLVNRGNSVSVLNTLCQRVVNQDKDQVFILDEGKNNSYGAIVNLQSNEQEGDLIHLGGENTTISRINVRNFGKESKIVTVNGNNQNYYFNISIAHIMSDSVLELKGTGNTLSGTVNGNVQNTEAYLVKGSLNNNDISGIRGVIKGIGITRYSNYSEESARISGGGSSNINFSNKLWVEGVRQSFFNTSIRVSSNPDLVLISRLDSFSKDVISVRYNVLAGSLDTGVVYVILHASI